MCASVFVRRLFSLHLRRLPGMLLALACAAAWGQEEAAAPAPPPAPRGVLVAEIKGAIAPALVPKLQEAFKTVNADRFPTGIAVIIDSPGGDGLAAIRIGRLLRQAKAHVFVSGRCASACVFLLAAGVVRGVPRDGVVGIHSPRLAAFVKGIGVVDINSASNPKAAAALEEGNRKTQEYFREMGLPDAFFDAMMAAPPDKTRYLDLSELADLGLGEFDPAYRAERAPVGAAFYGITEEEFVRRTGAVASKCLGDGQTSRSFARCYRRVLQTGE